jgi:putative addiction module component (TIGR02574 family)
MDLMTVIREVGAWPVEDRLRLMEEIWEGLLDDGYEPELTDELKAKLDRRLAALDADPENGTTWDAIKEYVRLPR